MKIIANNTSGCQNMLQMLKTQTCRDYTVQSLHIR